MQSDREICCTITTVVQKTPTSFTLSKNIYIYIYKYKHFCVINSILF